MTYLLRDKLGLKLFTTTGKNILLYLIHGVAKILQARIIVSLFVVLSEGV